MNLKVKLIFLYILCLLLYCHGFSQSDRNGMVGIVDLLDNQLFTNITKVCFTADNEKYFPSLFTVELPNSIENYWCNMDKNSEYLFKFGKDQFVFIFDDVTVMNNPLSPLQEKKLHEIDKDSADSYIYTWQNNSWTWESIMKRNGFEKLSDYASGHFYVATYYNVFFVFYNIVDIDVQNILNSFIVIRPHKLQIVE